MINKYTNKQRGLLAVIMAMVMVFAGAAFVAAEVDASESTYSDSAVFSDDGHTITVDNFSDFNKAMKEDAEITTIVLASDITVPTGNVNYQIKKNIDLGEFTLENKSYSYSEDNGYGGISFYFYDGITIENGTLKNASPGAGNLRIAQGVAGGNIGVIFQDVTFTSDYGAMVSASGLKTEFIDCIFDTKGNNGLYINNSNLGAKVTNCTFIGDYGEGAVTIDRITEGNVADVMIIGDVPTVAVTIVKGKNLDGITITEGKIDTIKIQSYQSYGVPEYVGTSLSNNVIIIKHPYNVGEFNVNDNIVIAEGQTIFVDESVTMNVTGTITNNGDMICAGTINNLGVVINNGSFTNNGIINNGVSVLEVTGSTGSFVNNGSFINGQGAEFNNNEGSTFTNDGTATLENGSEFVNDGAYVGNTLLAETGANITGDNQDQVGTLTGSTDDSLNLKGTLEGDMDITKNVYLSDDLVIAEGVTMKITSKGSLELMGYALTVLGTLEIENNGKITAVGGGRILIGTTGTITNDGMIGADSNVVIGVAPASDGEYTPQGTVTVNNIIGAEFSLKKEVVETTITYTLVVGGDISKKGTSYAFSVNGSYIEDMDIDIDGTATLTGVTILKNGSLTIGSKAVVTITDEIKLSNGVTLTVDGALVTGDVHMLNGSTAVINGNVNGVDFCAKTGDYNTYDGEMKNNPETTLSAESKITLDKITGFTITVTSKTYVIEDDGTETSMTLQALNITGEASFIKDVTTGGTITVTEDVYIPVGSKVVLSEGMSVGTGSGKFIVQGTLQTLDDDNIVYEGAAYSVKVPKEPSGNYIVYYYTNFDDAFAAIETAEYKTVTISGDYEFVKDYTIAAGQTIVFDSSVGVEYTIAADATITVEADGTFGTNFVKADASNSIPAGIQGILIVKEEGTCTPVADSYEVKSVSEDGTITYSGAAIAIENAKEGDVIDIVNAVVFTDDMTIPAGVTVEVASTGSITAEKGLTVAGKIVNEGIITVGGDLNVSGEIENENTVTVEPAASGVVDKNTATITGTYTGVLTATDGINAANFSDEGVNTYTNVADAVATVAEMDVPAIITVTGKFTENSDVVLAEGQKLVIDGEVVLKSIRLDVGSNLIVNGKLTADVIAATGVMDTTGALADSVISVKEIEDVEFDVKKNDAKNTVTMYMDVIAFGNMKGTTTVTAGSVQLDAALIVSKDNVFKVSEGATLVVMENISAGSGNSKYFSNAGTLIINKTGVILNGLNLGGTVAVADNVNVSLTNATVSGALTTGEDASVTVTDVMYVGSKPTTLGAAGTVNADVAFGNNAYIVVFEGSTFTNTDADVKMDSTAYTINDIAFATVYIAEGNSVSIDVLNEVVNGLKDLDIPYTDDAVDHDNDPSTDPVANGKLDLGEETYSWKSGSNPATSVGQYDIVNAKIGYASVDVTISVGPGMLVYIDDIKDTDGKESLTIGTHTITVYIEKGYEGTPAITLNGVAVTDGKLVITTDMMDLEQNLLSVTGATVMQDQPVVIQPSDSEKDGMELTDILLIVLVVLIVIMAIIVALRMMRS